MTKTPGLMQKLGKNWLEWLVFGCGLILTVATVGYLVSEATGEEPGSPRVVVRIGAPEAGSAGFTVPVTLTNEGDLTAEGVLVEVSLAVGDGEPERGEFTIGFLPGHSTREGAVTFHADPRTGRVTARVLGFEVP